MINKPPPFKGLNIRISRIIPIKGMRFINQGPTLVRPSQISGLISSAFFRLRENLNRRSMGWVFRSTRQY